MKQTKWFALAIALVLTFNAFGQEKSNVVKINIFSPIVKTFNIAYERAISENASLQGRFFYTGFKASDTKFSGFGITPEFRYYLSEAGVPKGGFIAPFVSYASYSLEEEVTGSEATLTNIGGGVIIGAQALMGPVTLEGFIGPQYISGSTKVDIGQEDDFDIGSSFDGFGVRVGVTIGIAF